MANNLYKHPRDTLVITNIDQCSSALRYSSLSNVRYLFICNPLTNLVNKQIHKKYNRKGFAKLVR
jgi:hypothetical protein